MNVRELISELDGVAIEPTLEVWMDSGSDYLMPSDMSIRIAWVDVDTGQEFDKDELREFPGVTFKKVVVI